MKDEAKKLGWRKARGNMAQVLPGKLIGGDIYKNRDGRLPQAGGEFGTRLILTIQAGIEIIAAFCFQMMVCCLPYMITIRHFMKSVWRDWSEYNYS